MNGPQSIHLSNFKPPQSEPIWAGKSFIFLALNILTLGIYGAAEKLSKQHRVKELRFNQEELRAQISGINNEWETLENNLSELLRQFNGMDSEETYQQKIIKSGVKRLSGENDSLNDRELHEEYPLHATISEVALGTFAFLGQLFANIVTIGLYGVYMNYSLKNQITLLEAQNDHIRGEFNQEKNNRYGRVNHIIGLFEANLDVKDELHNLQAEFDDMKNTDKGQAYIEMNKAKQELDDLQNRQEQLQKDLAALRVQKVAAEQAKKNLEKDLGDAQDENAALLKTNQAQANNATKLAEERNRLANDIGAKDAKIAEKVKEMRDLQVQFNIVRQKAADVQRLEREVSRLKDAGKYQPEVQKLQPELGPIDPEYTPRKDVDGPIPGAMDIKEQRKKPSVDAEWIDFAEKYNARYGDKYSAAEIIEESFHYSFEQLMDMAANGDKIKFNKSMQIPVAAARFALFRHMALDLLTGAQVPARDDCHHGYRVQINPNVRMLPSEPEKVLQFKKDDQKGNFHPVVIINHKQRDDFTPSAEDCLKSFIPYGVDPTSAKWILEQLTNEEKGHLFNLLMSPVIENEHEDLVKAKEFMQNMQDPRVELVKTAYNLICNIAAAFDGKFKDTVFAKCYETHLDMDDYALEPFIKEEDIDYTHVKDETPTGPVVVEWELDLDVIGDKRGPNAKPSQPNFIDVITFSKVRQESFFKNLDRGLIVNPEPKDKKFPTNTLGFSNLNNQYDINRQYWVTHQMIGADAAGDGGQRCLFSNLLAILVSNKNDLTDHNVNCMRKAMANYLDKLQRARDKWNKIKNMSDLPDDSDQIKEMAELSERFEKLISQYHNKTTVPAYQLWLRKEPVSMIGGQWVYPAQNLEAKGLTELEILLCAWTFGVKICLLTITKPSFIEVDDFGRIVPGKADEYGPNTSEKLFMGANDGSYYGLACKINIPDGLEPDDEDNLADLSDYWRSIPPK